VPAGTTNSTGLAGSQAHAGVAAARATPNAAMIAREIFAAFIAMSPEVKCSE
jgi:hypothetical protein